MECKIVEFTSKGDERGQLVALEQGREIPFPIKRVYYIYDTKTDVERGFHAHKQLEQVAVCVKGSCKFRLFDGIEKMTVELSTPEKGLHIKGMVWREMFDFSPDCVLMVVASLPYDEADYIRDYDKFLEMTKR